MENKKADLKGFNLNSVDAKKPRPTGNPTLASLERRAKRNKTRLQNAIRDDHTKIGVRIAFTPEAQPEHTSVDSRQQRRQAARRKKLTEVNVIAHGEVRSIRRGLALRPFFRKTRIKGPRAGRELNAYLQRTGYQGDAEVLR